MMAGGRGGVGHVGRALPEAVAAPPEGSGAGGWASRPFVFYSF